MARSLVSIVALACAVVAACDDSAGTSPVYPPATDPAAATAAPAASDEPTVADAPSAPAAPPSDGSAGPPAAPPSDGSAGPPASGGPATVPASSGTAAHAGASDPPAPSGNATSGTATGGTATGGTGPAPLASAGPAASSSGLTPPLDERQSAKAQDAYYSAWLQGARSYPVGRPATVQAVLVAKAGYKCNDAYPYKFALDAPPPGVSYPSDVARAVSKGKERTVVTVPFTPETAGTKTIRGTFFFSVCDASTCKLGKSPMAISVEVQ